MTLVFHAQALRIRPFWLFKRRLENICVWIFLKNPKQQNDCKISNIINEKRNSNFLKHIGESIKKEFYFKLAQFYHFLCL